MFKSAILVQEPSGDALLSSGRSSFGVEGNNRFPFDDVADDQCLSFSLVILPHFDRFLKFYNWSLSTLRRIRSDDYTCWSRSSSRTCVTSPSAPTIAAR
jgi:hypothetical protein